MPNKKIHLLIGLIIFIIYYFILNKLSLMQYLPYGITIFLGAILPDFLDPWTKANRYDHRSVWHSTNLIKPLAIIGVVSFVLMFFFHSLIYILFLIFGYLSHLSADSIKSKSWSKGLPSYPTFTIGIRKRYNF